MVIGREAETAKTPKELVDLEPHIHRFETYLSEASLLAGGYPPGDRSAVLRALETGRGSRGGRARCRAGAREKGGCVTTIFSPGSSSGSSSTARWRWKRSASGRCRKRSCERPSEGSQRERARQRDRASDAALAARSGQTLYEHKEARQTKHRKITEKAEAQRLPDSLGPFPLLYVDPPWQFTTFAPSGQDSERAPKHQHYPTMSDEDGISPVPGGRHQCRRSPRRTRRSSCGVPGLTSSALRILNSWGFDYKAQAVWVKDQIGTSYVFRPRHELLLYATRGNMPAPIYAPGLGVRVSAY